MNLRTHFLAHVAESLRKELSDLDELEQILTSLLQAAVMEWPQLELAEDRFVEHLAGALAADPEADAEQALRSIRSGELYLACAAGDGNETAIQAFETRFFTDVDILVLRFRARIAADEVKQALREKLFVRASGRAPKVHLYAGRGSLRTWFRVTATRHLSNMLSRGIKETPVSSEFIADKLLESVDPELEYLRRTYVAEYRAAFSAATKALSERQRNLLRYSFIDGLSIDEIGAIYGNHRATAARWLNAARDQLVSSLKATLRSRLDIDHETLESILRLIRSRLDVTIERYLED